MHDAIRCVHFVIPLDQWVFGIIDKTDPAKLRGVMIPTKRHML
jgi:hypothetical protein